MTNDAELANEFRAEAERLHRVALDAWAQAVVYYEAERRLRGGARNGDDTNLLIQAWAVLNGEPFPSTRRRRRRR